jgi:signal transduction histidine kinase
MPQPLKKPLHLRWKILLGVCIVASGSLIALSEIGYVRVDREYTTAVESIRNYSKLEQLGRKLVDAESGQRGYLLTHDPIYLEPYNAAVPLIKGLLDDLTAYYSEGNVVDPRLNTLIGFVAQKLGGLEVNVTLARQNKWAEAAAILKTGRGKEQMDGVRAIIDQLQKEQQEISNASIEQVRYSIQLSRWTITVLVILNSLLHILVFIWLRREAKLSAERELILDHSINERTEQLALLATHLQEISEAEKTRMGRELHDELGAILTATKMDLGWVLSKIPSGEEMLSDKLERAINNLDQGIKIKRRIIEGLRPTTLASFGLVTAARELVVQAAEQAHWNVTLELPEADPDLPEEAEIAMFRILQESLNNAAKYAQASRVRISLMCTQDHCKLEVEDNGIGFRQRDVRPKAAGLMGMRERLRARGGKLDIETGPGHGTLIRALLPLTQVDDELLGG